jgi:putative transposase
MNNNRASYTTDLSDSEWEIIEPLIPGQKRRGAKIQYDRREVLNGIFYLVRNGCGWRDLPHDLPPYRTVSHYYHLWRREGLWQTINDTLRTELRVAEGRNPQPSAASIDSQSVKASEIASPRGYDAGKKIKGIKRHILVDTMGLLLIVVVHIASIQDRDGAKLVLKKVPSRFPRLKLIWADGGYRGKLIEWVKNTCQCVLEIVKRNDDIKGFKVLPHRWVVERTFGWLSRYRRLSKNYERLPESSEAMVEIAMIRLMLRRLAAQRESKNRTELRRKERVAARDGYALMA